MSAKTHRPITFAPTWTDILGAYDNHCPIAIALTRLLKDKVKQVYIVPHAAEVWGQDGLTYKIGLPHVLLRWIAAFDAGKRPPPRSFTIQLPKALIP